ncbi:hypothetical protein C8R44DRAFT_800888 [Mycena epipterygia]|nr:hypothetical protein C8R44DRAFT_800888 [Mycena epipterygia]
MMDLPPWTLFAVFAVVLVIVVVAGRFEADDDSGAQNAQSQSLSAQSHRTYGTSGTPQPPTWPPYTYRPPPTRSPQILPQPFSTYRPPPVSSIPPVRTSVVTTIPAPSLPSPPPLRRPPPVSSIPPVRTSVVTTIPVPSLPSPPPLHRQTWDVDDLPPSSAVLREQAAEEGRRMAESFSQSRIVRLRGFRAEARRLAQAGKDHQRTMEALNKTASEMIFKEKNKDREPQEIDLHGLFVKEAESKVKEAILAGEQRGVPVIRFIVGQGLHTADGTAKLKPALAYYIGQMPRPVQVDSRNAGVLVVTLRLQGAEGEVSTRRKAKRNTRRGRASP